MRAAGSGEEDAPPKQVEFGSAEHPALDQLEPVHLPFRLTVAPGRLGGATNGGEVVTRGREPSVPSRKRRPSGGQVTPPAARTPPILTRMADELEKQLKSLELLQGIINRLSGHGFLLKGWAVTLTVGLLTFTGTTGQARLAALAGVPTLMFWVLDASFLAREHEYRRRFEALRLGRAEPFDFRLPPLDAPSWARAMFSRTLGLFYGLLVAVTLLLAAGVV